MKFGNVRVVGHEANYHKQLFFKAWFSVQDPQSGNGHITIPEVYKSLACAYVSHHVFKKVCSFFPQCVLDVLLFESCIPTL